MRSLGFGNGPIRDKGCRQTPDLTSSPDNIRIIRRQRHIGEVLPDRARDEPETFEIVNTQGILPRKQAQRWQRLTRINIRNRASRLWFLKGRPVQLGSGDVWPNGRNVARVLDKAHIVYEVGVLPVQQGVVVRETPVEHLFQTVYGLVVLKVWRL